MIGVATHGSFFAEAIGGDLAGKLRPHVFAAAKGYNYSRGRRVTLTLFAR